MTLTATALPTHQAYSKTLDHILSDARDIYTCLYPNTTIHLVLHAPAQTTWGQPKAFDPDAPVLTRLTLSATGPNAPEVTIPLTMPMPVNTVHHSNAGLPWHPPRVLAPVFAASPILYERIRYLIEVWRRRRRANQPIPTVSLPAVPAHIPTAPLAEAQRPAILIGMHWLEVGGAEKMGFDTITWALAAGLRVFVVAGLAGPQGLANRLPDHPDLRFLRPDLYLKPDDWPRYLENLIRAENIMLVHNHHCSPLYAALPYLASVTPWVRNIDTTHIIENQGGGYPQMSGALTQHIDVHHVISRELVRWFCDHFKVPKKIRLGRMLSRDPDNPSALPPLTMTAGQPKLHIVFVGRLNYQKRPIVVVEALRVLAKWARGNNIALRATILGEGPFHQAVSALLDRYNLTGMVTLAPADTHVPTVLKTADILLLPSNNEGLALVCYEAIEQGCIPLSTRVGSQDEIIPPDLQLPLDPPATIQSIKNIVDRLWRSPDFLLDQQTKLHACYQAIASDPTAQEVLMPLYKAVADGKDI